MLLFEFSGSALGGLRSFKNGAVFVEIHRSVASFMEEWVISRQSPILLTKMSGYEITNLLDPYS